MNGFFIVDRFIRLESFVPFFLPSCIVIHSIEWMNDCGDTIHHLLGFERSPRRRTNFIF